MSYLVHNEPNLYTYGAKAIDARPGLVALDRSAFHPGGGGQGADVGTIQRGDATHLVRGITIDDDGVWWHQLDGDDVLQGDVEVHIDQAHRRAVAALHTASHILNALVFAEFDGALVTGAHIAGPTGPSHDFSTARGRMDFDLPDVDNDRLRALAPPLQQAIDDELEVAALFVDAADTATADGLIRSMSVAPPPSADGQLRVIDIKGLDRQACGGTHLSNTGESPPVTITKIENKGRHNRRVRFQFA